MTVLAIFDEDSYHRKAVDSLIDEQRGIFEERIGGLK